MDRWALAEIMHEARIKLAWGSAWEGRKLPWPKTGKERRAYTHNPNADIDLHLASADAVIKVIRAEGADVCMKPNACGCTCNCCNSYQGTELCLE